MVLKKCQDTNCPLDISKVSRFVKDDHSAACVTR